MTFEYLEIIMKLSDFIIAWGANVFRSRDAPSNAGAPANRFITGAALTRFMAGAFIARFMAGAFIARFIAKTNGVRSRTHMSYNFDATIHTIITKTNWAIHIGHSYDVET